MEKPEEVENVPMPGGIVVTKHQATLIEEAVRLVLLWWGGTTILIILERAGDGRLGSYRLAWALLELVFGLHTSPFLLPRLALGSTPSAPLRPLPFSTEARVLVM